MKKILLILPILLVAGGCLRPLTRRLDALQNEVSVMSAKLDETNRLLGGVEKHGAKIAGALPGP